MEGLQIGRIVHYVLTQDDANEINHRRNQTSPEAIRNRIESGKWNVGTQAHVGNSVIHGEHVAGLVVGIWEKEFGEDLVGINIQCILDGNDSFWVTSKRYDENLFEGTWHFPERT